MNTWSGTVGVRDARRLRAVLATVAAGHGLVLVGAALLFVPLLAVFPAFAAVPQLLTMVRLHPGDVPLRGGRTRR